MLYVAPTALPKKFQSITGAMASKQVSEADGKDFSSVQKIVALSLQEGRQTDVQANNN